MLASITGFACGKLGIWRLKERSWIRKMPPPPQRNEEENVVHILRIFNETQRWKEQVLDKKLLHVH
jgi:hypothetical protein